MGFMMKKASQKSLKTVTLDKSRLKQEMTLHPGNGKNHTCIYKDVANLLGYENAKSIINKHYTFPVEQVNRLCAAWGVRSEYLQGLDDFRSDDDLYRYLALSIGQEQANTTKHFLNSIGFDFVPGFIFSIPKSKYKKSYANYGTLLEDSGFKDLVTHTDKDNIDICMTDIKGARKLMELGFMYNTYYIFRDDTGEPIGILDVFEMNLILDILKDNAYKTIMAFSRLRNNWIDKSVLDNSEYCKNYFNAVKDILFQDSEIDE